MSKTVLPTHIISERGVNAFADYCNRHQPYIIWREETKNDFGVDGEVELTEVTTDGKTKPTSQILKVQIKATQNDSSYMARETAESFFFYASESDMEYWKNYRQYGYQVLLVIFDGREGNEFLYCKQITDIDVGLTTKKGKQKSQPIEFSKTQNLLIAGQNDFVGQFRASFKSRVNHFTSEVLDTNMLPFKSIPRWLYTYPTHYKTKKDIFTKIAQGEAPYFIIKNSLIYTFVPIEKDFKFFFEQVISEGQKRSEYRYADISKSVVMRNYYVELLNDYIRDFMRRRGLFYQRDHQRYHFFLKEDQSEYKVPYRTRKIDKETEKPVVTYHQYGKDQFFRHWAIEAKPLFVEESLFLVISHKYLFTSDRKNPLKPDKITKYTNYLNARTFNDGVLDLLHFWWYHLSKGSHEITVFDGSALNQPSITLSKAISFTVKFGLPLDGEKITHKKKPSNSSDVTQTTLPF